MKRHSCNDSFVSIAQNNGVNQYQYQGRNVYGAFDAHDGRVGDIVVNMVSAVILLSRRLCRR